MSPAARQPPVAILEEKKDDRADDREAKWNEGFKKFLSKNPDATFAQFYAHRVRTKIDKGQSHSTLGGDILDPKHGEIEFAEAGRKRFRSIRKMTGLRSHHRLVDYGCGSLRIGYHAMLYLDPGHYFGLDVTNDFIDMGKELIGDALTERQPHLAAIAPKSLAAATAFGADFVLSSAVAMHVHPDEAATYYGSLQSLASKPGARVYFSVRLADKPERFAQSGWAWPLQFYIDSLPQLAFVGKTSNGMLQFRRPV
jgi:hypothetical protein